MKNKELKKQLVENGKFEDYRKTKRANADHGTYDLFEVVMTMEDARRILFPEMTPEEIIECERMSKSRYQQRKKIYDHLMFLFKGNWDLYFITWTFSDEILNSTKSSTRKQKVIRSLSKCFVDYINNIDYAPDTNREHFHSVVAKKNASETMYFEYEKGVKHIKFHDLDCLYKYGHYKVVPIRLSETDAKTIAGYIAKLTSHSIKVKQSYVSTKKGSPWQQYKELLAQRDRQGGHAYGRAFTMSNEEFEEKEIYLLSGFATD